MAGGWSGRFLLSFSFSVLVLTCLTLGELSFLAWGRVRWLLVPAVLSRTVAGPLGWFVLFLVGVGRNEFVLFVGLGFFLLWGLWIGLFFRVSPCWGGY